MPFGWPTPGRPIGRPGVGCPQGVFGVFSYYQLMILSFNIVLLIVEFTMRRVVVVEAHSVGGVGVGYDVI
jgi:hypothetical protein